MLPQSRGGNLRGLESTARPFVAATDPYGFQMSWVAHRDEKMLIIRPAKWSSKDKT
jgi:hypothetical protein